MRRTDRELTNIQEILNIIKQAKVLHLGLFDSDYPYIVPLNYGYEYIDNSLVFYMHGAKQGHKIDLLNANPKVCIQIESDVALVTGGEIACKYGMTYASVICQGTISLVTDTQEKIKGLNLLMKNQTNNTYTFDKKMINNALVMKVVTQNITAKTRKQ